MKKILLIFIIFLIPFKVSAKSTILMDMDTNRIYYEENIHDIRSVASISKIMTCILAIESNRLYEEVEIGDEILSSYGSGIYIQKGEKLLLIDLLYGLMLRSGNDAALAIANFISDDFVKLMNEKAKELNMNDTTFNNPSGLDIKGIGNYSTAYDMAILTSYAMKNDTYKKIVGTKKYKLATNKNSYLWTNKHKLVLSYDFITGGKTGFTDIARRTLVTTGSKDGINLVVVTLNDGNDFNNHLNLLKNGFEKYNRYRILKKGKISIIDDKNVNKEYCVKYDFYYNLDDIEKNNVVIKINVYSDKAKILVYLYNNVIYEGELEIKEKKKTFLDWFKNIW